MATITQTRFLHDVANLREMTTELEDDAEAAHSRWMAVIEELATLKKEVCGSVLWPVAELGTQFP